ncbi:hypothetical protein ABZP36_026832 [Zizania latifolia]
MRIIRMFLLLWIMKITLLYWSIYKENKMTGNFAGCWHGKPSNMLLPMIRPSQSCCGSNEGKDSELSDARFAWLCVKHVKSNAIAIAKNNCMLGMGSGQPNRLESLRIAFRKAGAEAEGSALASDAYFPFAISMAVSCSIMCLPNQDLAQNATAWNDAVEEACMNGIAVIAEPGGSKRDIDAVDCCNTYGVSFLFTGVRHFRH